MAGGWPADKRYDFMAAEIDACCIFTCPRLWCLRHCNWSSGYAGSTSSASIRCARSRPRRQESSATCAERWPCRGLSCAFRDRRDRVRSRVTSCHQVGAGRGGYLWVGLHEFRWAMAWPEPVAGSRAPERGWGAGLQRPVWAVVLPLWGHRWRHRLSFRLSSRWPLTPQIAPSSASGESTLVTAPDSAR